MITPINLDHIVLNTYDKFDAMLDFYCQTLGCQVEREVQEFNLTQLRAGNAIIDLFNTKMAKPTIEQSNSPQNNLLHFCITIAQTINNQLIEQLQQHNIETSSINYNYGAQGFGDSIYITDPVGNVVELKHNI
ncbi:VOC family protein [Thalassotalea atypica]|uniref:VOC family protein n=1 Tax=Thalassotalea atypica TaxID=2054316 RepID=UPI002572DCD4|nr:VOC family protein [Thalassotalea atypica]